MLLRRGGSQPRCCQYVCTKITVGAGIGALLGGGWLLRARSQICELGAVMGGDLLTHHPGKSLGRPNHWHHGCPLPQGQRLTASIVLAPLNSRR